MRPMHASAMGICVNLAIRSGSFIASGALAPRAHSGSRVNSSDGHCRWNKICLRITIEDLFTIRLTAMCDLFTYHFGVNDPRTYHGFGSKPAARGTWPALSQS